jgi:MoaA/NifB/PqqE/SkfB family radical SAM enzyme
VSDAKRLWGVPLFVISGGEPLMYASQGHDIMDLVERHDDCLFLMFTNGTLLDDETALRMARAGNVTPALSVEGDRDRTDFLRGHGTFDIALNSMNSLRNVGVPFGISVTATRQNCQEILSDGFLDMFFNEQGALYGFIFRYTPIGIGASMDLVPDAEQTVQFWKRSWDVVRNRRILLLDFWNHGPLVEGCISAGREKGYLYIDWRGRVMPCVFAPFSMGNVQEIYDKGGTLEEIWSNPFFQTIRRWQRNYGYAQTEHPPDANWMQPCPFFHHNSLFREWVEQHGAEPVDVAAQELLVNEDLQSELDRYSTEYEKASTRLWEEHYLSSKTVSID